MTTLSRKTQTRRYSENGENFEITVTYGFDVPFAERNHQAPHFAITADVYRIDRYGGKVEYSFGCQHDLIARLFPKLRALIRWHLVSTDQPMHYAANAVYWAQKAAGVSKWKSESYDPDPLEAFKSTVVFGAVDGDALPHCLTVDHGTDESASVRGMIGVDKRIEIENWCRQRLPALRAAFDRDMIAAGVMIPASDPATTE